MCFTQQFGCMWFWKNYKQISKGPKVCFYFVCVCVCVKVSLAVADILVGLVAIPCAVLTNLGEPRHNLPLCLVLLSFLLVLTQVGLLGGLGFFSSLVIFSSH